MFDLEMLIVPRELGLGGRREGKKKSVEKAGNQTVHHCSLTSCIFDKLFNFSLIALQGTGPVAALLSECKLMIHPTFTSGSPGFSSPLHQPSSVGPVRLCGGYRLLFEH